MTDQNSTNSDHDSRSSSKTRKSNSAASQNYQDHPSALHYLFKSEGRQILVDYFLDVATEWEEDDEPLTKADIIDATGLDRRSIGKHIDVLIEFGLVETTDNEDSRWDRYYPNVDSDVLWAMHNLNNELIKAHERRKRNDSE